MGRKSFFDLKKPSQTYCVQNRLFCHIFRFFELPDVNSGPFWVLKRVPGDDFWVIFEGKTWLRFRNTFFYVFEEKKRKNAKNEKVAFVL